MGSRRGEHGHTMVELTVVGLIMAILATVSMQAASPMALSSLKLRDRNLSSTELRMAMLSICQDLGGAEGAKAPGGRLEIEREEAVLKALGLYSGGKDQGVEYSITDGDLHRNDKEADTDVIVARGLTSFVAVRIPTGGVRIVIVSGSDMSERTVELRWTY